MSEKEIEHLVRLTTTHESGFFVTLSSPKTESDDHVSVEGFSYMGDINPTKNTSKRRKGIGITKNPEPTRAGALIRAAHHRAGGGRRKGDGEDDFKHRLESAVMQATVEQPDSVITTLANGY